MPKKLTQEEFVEKARKIHGNTYSYDKVVYINSYTHVIITCPAHGDFPQTPDQHLRGNGCPKCYGNAKMTTEEFIKRAREVHGGSYSYDKVVYINSYTQVIITCPIHGDFPQRPDNHIGAWKSGCSKCVGLAKLTTEDFIKKARGFLWI